MNQLNTFALKETLMERPLGVGERLMHKMRDYGGLNASFILKFQGTIDTLHLSNTLRVLTKQHPILNCHVIEKKNEPQSNIPSFRLMRHQEVPIEVLDIAHENEVIYLAELGTQFLSPPGERLWKLHLLRLKHFESECSKTPVFFLLILFDHTIVDGVTLCQFAKLLCQTYDDLLEKSSDTITSTEPVISHPLEKSLGYKFRIKDFLYFFPTQLSKMLFAPTPQKFQQKAPASNRKTRVLKNNYSFSETCAIIHAAKANGTTVQGALVSALMFSVCKYGLEQSKSYRLSCTSPVNMRSECQVDNHVLGPYSSAVAHLHQVNKKTTFWHLAQEIKTKINISLKRQEHISSVFIFEWLQRLLSDSFRIKVMDGKNMGRLDSVAVSNIGRVEMVSNYKHFELKEMDIIVGQHGMGASFTMVPITLNGKLSFFLHYVDPLTDKVTAEHINQSVRQSLLRSTKEDFSFSEF